MMGGRECFLQYNFSTNLIYFQNLMHITARTSHISLNVSYYLYESEEKLPKKIVLTYINLTFCTENIVMHYIFVFIYIIT